MWQRRGLVEFEGRLYVRYIVACFSQQQADCLLSLRVLPLAEVTEPEIAAGIDDVLRWPIAVVEAAPCAVVVVLDDQPLQVVLNGGVADLFNVLLELELWGMNS